MKRALSVLALAALVLSVPAFATTVDADVEARVPALSAFHEVVYPLWHAAAAKKDGPALLSAAESLHSQFERMVRIIRPVPKELEAFHATLYVFYHRQLDPIALEGVSQSVRTLKEKMGPLSAASLPERLKAKEPTFVVARAQLATAVDAAVASLEEKDEKAIRVAVDLLHARYQEVEKVFG